MVERPETQPKDAPEWRPHIGPLMPLAWRTPMSRAAGHGSLWQAVVSRRAWLMLANCSWLRKSSSSFEWKLSAYPFSQGLPGAT